MAKCLVLDVNKNETRIAECNELDDFYRELDAEPFDIVTKEINGRSFDIFVDDVGLFREKPVVSAIYKDHSPALVGNLIFANHDSEGNTTSLSSKDIGIIRNNLITLIDVHSGKEWTVVMLD